MAIRRIWYLAGLLGCWIFYLAYGEWFSWLLLWAVLGLPWLSLLLSLPALLRFRISADGPTWLLQGTTGDLWLLGSCPMPMPPFRGKLRLKHNFTGESRRYTTGAGLIASHCGCITVTVEKPRVCDYLGIFSFPVKPLPAKTLLVRPVPLPIADLPALKQWTAARWKPKFGGGFAENHELRLYRPGDSLNQVHWKLSAKTGKLILREPMEPIREPVLLTMTLKGSPEELDRKLGRLLWLGNRLLQEKVPFTLRVLAAEGILFFPTDSESQLNKAVDALLQSTPVKEGSIRNHSFAASRQYHIGGAADEA